MSTTTLNLKPVASALAEGWAWRLNVKCASLRIRQSWVSLPPSWRSSWGAWTNLLPTSRTPCLSAGKVVYRPELARTCCDYADALRERDGPGDKEKAIALLDESLAISGELGMRPLMQRVLSRREISGECGASPDPTR